MVRVWGWVVVLGVLGGMGCSAKQETLPPRTFNLYQNWSLQPGDKLAGY